MRGTIRMIAGLLLVMGSVGGMDNGGPIATLTGFAAIGLLVMYSGIRAMEQK